MTKDGEDLDDLLDEFSGSSESGEEKIKPKKKSVKKEDDGEDPLGGDIPETKSKKKKEEKKEDEGGEEEAEKAEEIEEEPKEKKSTKKEEKKDDDDFLSSAEEPGDEETGKSKKDLKEEKRQEKIEERKKSSVDKEEFDYSEDNSPATANICIYAHKGKGKTSLAFSALGTHNCISFDNKSKVIRDNLSEEDQARIHVFNGGRYLNKSSAEDYTESSVVTWRYIRNLVMKSKEFGESDWVDVDGGERFERIAEQVMRFNQGLGTFEGFANRNLWKERRLIIGQMFAMCEQKARNGVIWTTYIDKDEIIKNGEIVTKKDVPRWIDAVMEETDCVIKVEADEGKDSGRIEYYATIESSKIPENLCKRIFGGILKVGMKVNITGRGFNALVEKLEGKEGKKKEEEF